MGTMRIALLVALLVVLGCSNAAGQWTQQWMLYSGAFSLAEQGYSVAISGDGHMALVGAPNAVANKGVAIVDTASGSVWSVVGSNLQDNTVTGANQGQSVSLSADGSTAAIGGPHYQGYIGGTWIYTRSGNTWTKQGGILVGTGMTGAPLQGCSVALSGDGNTLIVGGYWDAGYVGAAWVFTRSAGVWSQQGNKLVGTGIAGTADLGVSVAISADGNTVIVGGPNDSSGIGAAWVFVRSAAVWTQQGNKLVGTGCVGASYQGSSVAVSADGNTAAVGGSGDNNLKGAVWMFTRSNGIWTQQGGKLVGAGGVGGSYQGWSASMSADGNTLITGGYNDSSGKGAAWVYTRTGIVWSQQGGKIVPVGGGAYSWYGYSVAVCADGNTALIGGPMGSGGQGAAYVFTRSVTGVWGQGDATHQVPSEFMLQQNYPNPFNPATVIRYEVPARALVTVSLSNRDARESNVTLKVYDLLGRELATLVNEQKAPGRYEVRFHGAGLTSGVYVYRLQAGGFVETKKMVLLK